MEQVEKSLSQMMEMFQTRMANFEAELQKSPSTSSATTATGLAADFSSFKVFVTHSLNALQTQIRTLSRTVDNLEMLGRRKMLMIHGLPEQENEDTAQVVVEMATNSLKLGDFSLGGIKRCHRMGRPATASRKPRPIIVKFQEVTLRDQVWFRKSKLKNSGVTISEFLTHSRHCTFMAARQKYGVNKCWTAAGNIYSLGSDNSRRRIDDITEVNELEKPVAAAKSPKKVSSKPRRAAVVKK
ncbi:uncharacterized protein LOC113234867 [Hyposmocoma kahamanoa]|uniref:uncharacterized protein LOC113234867 n=1 Tax=Hyposmocoma kahamanoa TaxID=1477025 RepID=UPI000E6DA20F|nr:uncharacterized protein LOC113234867 [Hyposmocoma kahamanoa]